MLDQTLILVAVIGTKLLLKSYVETRCECIVANRVPGGSRLLICVVMCTSISLSLVFVMVLMGARLKA